MKAPSTDRWLVFNPRERNLARWLSVLAIVSVVPGIVGWLFGIRALIQPLPTFAPARVGGALLIPLAAGSLLAKVSGRRTLARRLAVIAAMMSAVGIGLAFRREPSLLDTWAMQRWGDASTPELGVISLTVGVLFLMSSLSVYLLVSPRQSEHTLIVVGGLAASQVALAGVLFMAQLAGLLDGTSVFMLRAPLHALFAALALGVGLLDRLSSREASTKAVPGWAPILAGVSSALLVLVVWQALNARDLSQLQLRSEITAEAINRAVQRQYRTVESSLGRGAAYLRDSRAVDDAVWSTGLPRMIEETAGIRHIVWFDSTGSLLRSASPDSVPAEVITALGEHVRSARIRTGERVVPHSTTVGPGPWRLALWIPIYSPYRGPTVLVGLIDDVQLIRPFLEDVAQNVWVRVRAGDTTLMQVGADSATSPRFTRTLSIGARILQVDVAERSRAPYSPLSDVVLALGLTVSLLLGTTLWQQRRIWLQAVDESQRFRAVFDTAFQVQLLLDLDGTVLEANRAAAELAETSADQLSGTAFWQVPWWGANQHTTERVQERFTRARTGETQRFEVEVVQSNDRTVTVDFSLKPLFDGTQRVTRVIAEGRDLTIRKRAEESLREISALTTMGQLAARVAHEINNPLAGIQNAFLLIRGAIPETHPHYRFVGAIEREIARIAAVTRQLYETYRPDQLMATQSSVILAVSDAVTFLEQVNRGRQVRIVTDMSRAPSMVPVPDALLRQTLYNLVQNAVDVSPPDGTVRVTAIEDGADCVLRVSDEGPGIPPAIRERIFDPFFSTKDRTMKTGGMGIGLALVRQSVQAVGGHITVHDRPMGGTEFEVRLPMIPLDTGVLR